MQVHTRIAPTPSGWLHRGNAFSFAITHQLVQNHGGSLLLRIDDLDAPRKRPEYVQDVFDTLQWMGIAWQKGPTDAADFETNFSQHHRLHLYHTYLERLLATGQVYACTCSRKAIAMQNAAGIYPGTCRHKHLPLDTPGASLRLRTDAGNMPVQFFDHYTQQTLSIDVQLTMGDFVIRRKDGLPAYQVASVADDVYYGINTIVRGADLLTSTAAQLYIAQLLGLSAFLQVQFWHLPLLTDEQGQKLSKSAGSASLQHLRQQGVPYESIRATFVQAAPTLLS